MKNILFATTALVATAGIASADVSISGFAEVGIADTGSAAGTADTSNVGLHQDVDVTFSMSGETDNGLAFGVSVDLDEAGLMGNHASNNGTALSLSGGFGKLTVGDTNGALDQAMTTITGPGSILDQETIHDGFKGNYLDGSYDGQIARYDYTAGDLTVSASVELLDTDATGRSGGNAIGVKYNMGNITFGAGMQSADVVVSTSSAQEQFGATNGGIAKVDATGVSASGTFGALTAGVVLTSYDSNIAGYDADHTHVGVSYTQGAMTLGANYGDFDSKTNAEDRKGYGVTANYSLGGGATVQAGYETSDTGAAGTDNGDSWSLGIAMAF